MSLDSQSTKPIPNIPEIIINDEYDKSNHSDDPYKPEERVPQRGASVASNMEKQQDRLSNEGGRKGSDSGGNKKLLTRKQTANRTKPEDTEGPASALNGNSPGEGGGNLKKDDKENMQPSIDKTDGWRIVYKEYKDFDTNRINQMDTYIDTLLTFAGLFSAALTAFLVQVYIELKPDNTQSTAPILLDISRQLYAISLGQTASISNVPLPSVDPPKLLVLTTSLWFISLVLALGAALFGILVKQWLREYMRWTDIFPLQHAIHVREYRNRDLENWHIEGIVSIISECLEVGLVLFFLGLAVLLWRINSTTAQVASVFVGLVLFAAIFATILPAFVSSCSYRTTFASLLRSLPAFPSRVLFPILYAVLAPIKTPIDTILSWINPGFGTDGLLSWLSDSPAAFHKSWTDFDMTSRLPRDVTTSLADRCASLFWLTSHRSVDEKLVQWCLSDLPGPPVDPRIADDEDSEWIAKDNRARQRLQLKVHCQALLSLIQSSHSEVLKTRITQVLNGLGSLVDTTYFDVPMVSFTRAIRRADEQSHNAISAGFFSLAKSLLSPQLFLSKDTDFSLVINLFFTIYSFWYYSEYFEAQINSRNASEINMGTDPTAQSYRYLEAVFTKLLAQPQQTIAANGDSRECYNKMVDILAYRYWSSDANFFDALVHSSPDDNTRGNNVANVMKIARQFVENNANSLEVNPPIEEPFLTGIFWRIVRPAFQPNVEKHLYISEDDHVAFLRAIRTVLQANIWNPRNDVLDPPAYFLVAYVLRHRSRLPDNFVATLKKASEKSVLDIEYILWTLSRRSASFTEGIRTSSKFWYALENPNELIVPDLSVESLNWYLHDNF